MRVPEFFGEAEARLREFTFEDIETVYADLVPHKTKVGNWMTMKTDKVGCDMRQYFEEERIARQALRNGDRMVQSKWLGKSVAADYLFKVVQEQIDKVQSVYCLTIRTVDDVQQLKMHHGDFFPKDMQWVPGLSYDILRSMYGHYHHIQVRPQRIVFNSDGSVKSKDPYEFLIKVFQVPAHPVYLELINQRVIQWSK